ncbi:Acetyltransferase (GNAT) domain-containing protein [Pseudoduganella namucuonensis]|uniref:Acetyltransferase (GNAT) domain-containing protein n=2 Tax=Pseudoduganella namucuonensis TaxID=1035707 RepID=A0A1I7K291_9BURK|nr:GNAT family N-acetyltransferase [Pseudoduganella namucuonensis]SFU91527.1 Acetyltransferase (GNAT) domain-containing protein [Pseudoduganella namucuonensis]
MTEDDLDAAQRLSLSVRWPHRLEDWQLIHRLGTGYVAEDETGLVGTVMCWSHGQEFASLGMVIVAEAWQGNGIGRKLMALVMAELGERTVLLHATEAGKALYESMGFETIGAVEQHQGTVFNSPLIPLRPGERIRPLGSRDGPRLAALAARAAGMPRATVLAALLEVSEGVVIDRYDEVIGCALLRRFGHGYVIGPVIAPDIERAKALISHWTGTYAGAFIRVDVAGDSGLGPWLTELGLMQVDRVLAMARGEAPLHDASVRQFAIINQALG